jgi:hypothetical protein
MTRKFGIWAAVAALVFSVAYGIPQLLQVAGILTDPWDRILIFAPSLALAPAFVLTMVAVHEATPAGRRVLSGAALSLAIMYAVLVSIVYIVQLGVVIPLDMRGEGVGVALFACCAQYQPMTAIDLLGYTLMSLSTGFAAPIFRGGGVARAASVALGANALLAPVLILQLVWPSLIYVGALWLVTFPLSMLFVALVFHRAPPSAEAMAQVRAFASHIEIDR